MAAPEFEERVAIVGMAGRFPGASDIGSLWQLIRAAQSGIRTVGDEDLIACGVNPRDLPPGHVRRQAVLDETRRFDAELFGYSPREAALLDPQQRILLETAWSALEHAGFAPGRLCDPAGIFVSGGWNAYLIRNLASHAELMSPEFEQQTLLANEKDSLATRLAFKLGLTGPTVTVQTACSSSLVAVCLAHQSLLDFQCDIALAGGVSLAEPQIGYQPQPGSILSPDGHCRPFDQDANGTVPGAGAAIVVLKRLADAMADGDTIHAVLLGSSVRNDGAGKAAFTAPSPEGQAAAIAAAWAMAGVPLESVGYIEAHGTGTLVGDPVEIAGLERVFADRLRRAGKTCPIGALKSNIGHLDAAAGVAGLVKTVLMMRHREIPPTAGFGAPNPHIDFARAGFEVSSELREWKSFGPRRAGVSAFGLGGTNAHVVLEEAPAAPPPEPDAPAFIALSANSEDSLERARAALAAHLDKVSAVRGVDVAHTLLAGRKALRFRRAFAWRGRDEAVQALQGGAGAAACVSTSCTPAVGFMFPGQSSALPGIAAALYDSVPAFREAADHCFDHLRAENDLDLAPMLLADADDAGVAAQLRRTRFAQPALFVLGYSAAMAWRAWGVSPAASIGHSLGEYVAACLAGLFGLEACLDLVVHRGELMERLPAGAMLAVRLDESATRDLLDQDLSLAAVNAANACVVAGSVEAIARMEERLEAQGAAARRLDTSRAFHSAMTDPILAEFEASFACGPARPGPTKFLSCLEGRWVEASEASTGAFWRRQAREPVRFAEALEHLLERLRADGGPVVLLELGPGSTLARLARARLRPGECALTTMESCEAGPAAMLEAAGQLWSRGACLDVGALWGAAGPRKIPLPTYPFEGEQHWIAPGPAGRGQDPMRSAVAAGRHAAQEFPVPETPDRQSALDELCAAHMKRAVAALAAGTGDGQLPPGLWRRDLVERWIETLASFGRAVPEGNGRIDSCSARISGEDDIEALARAARAAGASASHLRLIQRCGGALPALMTGDLAPLDLFCEVVEPGTAVCGDAAQRKLEAVLAASIRAIVAASPASAPLRVLEVGGGTGIAASVALPLLPADRATYLFTDVAPGFVNQARQLSKIYPFLECCLLDLDKPFAEQGPIGGPFDLLVAVNVLHATRDIGRALDRLRTVMAPDAMFLLWEITRHGLDFDITYSLLMNDVDERGRSRTAPFLSEDSWTEMLRTHGFGEVEPLTDRDAPESIFLARCTLQHDPHPPRDSKAALAKKADIADWFHSTSWRRGGPLARGFAQGRWLLFADREALAAAMARLLRASGAEVVEVHPGQGFAISDRGFIVDPRSPADYVRLISCLGASIPDRIVHMWDVARAPAASDHAALVDAADQGPVSLVHLAQAIDSSAWAEHRHSLTVVTTNAESVGDEPVVPERKFSLGAARVIPIEFSRISCRAVDVELPEPDELLDTAAARLLDEILAGGPPLVAHRGRRRWIQELIQAPLIAPDEISPRLREGGTYVITGGLGTLGLVMAEWLARQARAHVVLLSRRSLPSRASWAAPGQPADLATLFERLRRLEALGASVHPCSVDVADAMAVRRLLDKVERDHGPIRGIIHAAGLLGDRSIARQSRSDILGILVPKAAGCLALDAALDGRPLDFLLLFSSLSALKPEFGQVAYAAANAYLLGWAQSERARTRPSGCVTAIAWDVWQGEGMAYSAAAPKRFERIKREDFARRGILAAEGTEVVRRVLGSRLDEVLVSTSDYLQVLADPEASMSRLYVDVAEAGPAPDGPPAENGEIAPLVGLEAEIGLLWSALLGIRSVAVDSNFFDLGGDSLIATQLLNRINGRFGVRLTMKAFNDDPTIGGIASGLADVPGIVP